MLSAALPLICNYIAGFYHSFFLYLSRAGLKRYNLIISKEVAKSMSGIVKRNNKGSRRNQVVRGGNRREFLAEVACRAKAGTHSLPGKRRSQLAPPQISDKLNGIAGMCPLRQPSLRQCLHTLILEKRVAFKAELQIPQVGHRFGHTEVVSAKARNGVSSLCRWRNSNTATFSYELENKEQYSQAKPPSIQIEINFILHPRSLENHFWSKWKDIFN